MIEIDQARELVIAHAKLLHVAESSAKDSVGRVLAEDVTADVDSPPHDKALVDGFAVRVADVNGPDFVSGLRLIEKVIAGDVPTKPLTAGMASQIMTGAPIPDGAEAMVMVEDTEIENDRVRIRIDQIRPGQSIMRRAAAFAKGDVVLTKGTALRPIEVGLLSEVGRARVLCYACPTVAVLPTGEELVPATEVPQVGQIRNSNGPMLESLAQSSGCQTELLGVAHDDVEDLRNKIQAGLDADILILSGGVSAGVRDLVPPTLESLGVERVFHKVCVKPGKPVWFGVRNKPGGCTLVFGLPGNPVSSLVCFELFVRTAIHRLSGRSADIDWQPIRLATTFKSRGIRPTFWPATWSQNAGRLFADPLPWRGSSDMLSVSQADCWIYFDAGEREYQQGEKLRAIRIK